MVAALGLICHRNGEVNMRKSTLFLSVVLTSFMLAVLFGVASAYHKIVNTAQPTTVAQTEPTAEVQSADVQSASQLISSAPTGVVSPEQAAALAAQILGHTDVYSVESTTYEEAAAYLVTFSSGDLVYVSPAGQILAITKPEPTIVIITQPKHKDRPGHSSGGGSSSGTEEAHEPEHEQEHED